MRQTNKDQVLKILCLQSNSNISKGLTTGDVAENLSIQRTHASALLNELVTEDKATKTSTRPVRYFYKDSFKRDYEDYRLFIGYDGSLRKCVSQAKAAVIYPPKGLNTLIVGQRGSGKTLLAKIMHKMLCSWEEQKKPLLNASRK